MTYTSAHGKVCYIEMPCTDPARSAEFYANAIGWTIRTRGDGAIAFDDAIGEVSGSFVTGRSPSSAPGMLVYIMVDDIAAACAKIEAAGGVIVQPLGGDAPELTARFRDPGGNVLGLYQEPTQARS
jgi:predicted enzyme related to lactoylglutathione lyase